MDALRADIGYPVQPVVVERITGDEQAFRRDWQAAIDAERAATLAILTADRHETLTFGHHRPAADARLRRPTRTFAGLGSLAHVAPDGLTSG